VSITPETLAWLHQSAAVDGAAYSQVLLSLLDRVEALERIISIAKAVQEHAFSWEADARLIGNFCAEDVADLCGAILARWGRPTPPVPEPGDVGELIAWLHDHALNCRELGRNDWAAQVTSAADLLQQLSAPAPTVVPVAVSERLPGQGDCDDHQECWAWDTGAESWILEHYENCKLFTHWLPAHAIPLPQAGEVEP
jgi:hypothetical protein